MDRHAKIYVAGHRGLVGSAIVRNLTERGFLNLVVRPHAALDLEQQADVRAFFESERPEYVFLAAAKVGGIHANVAYPAEFIYNNLLIAVNVIEAAYRVGTRKLLFLGSSCIYPKDSPQPIREEYLLHGVLEPTNEPYAVSKIAGIKLCQSYNRQYGTDFISVMPTNLYGINDTYHLQNSHVLPALIHRFHDAKVQGQSQVAAWGTGTPRREFMYADDCADACVFLMHEHSGGDIINIGTGEDLTIRELTERVAQTVGYDGEIVWDGSQPDGMRRKRLDVTRLHTLGWRHRFSLEEGLRLAYQDFLSRFAT